MLRKETGYVEKPLEKFVCPQCRNGSEAGYLVLRERTERWRNKNTVLSIVFCRCPNCGWTGTVREVNDATEWE